MSVFGRRAFPVRLRTQIVLLQVVLVALTLGIAFGVFAYVSDQRLSGEYGQRALAVARTVASDPEVRSEVSRYSDANLKSGPALTAELSSGELQQLAVAAGQRTAALFVVITDDAGIRLAHPDPARLGERVSTDPSRALAGSEVVIRERGTLGESVRAKVPVLRPNGESVVGEVSVGISTEAVRDQLLRDLRRAGLLVGLALLAGVAGSLLLARRWHGLTLGLEPQDLAELVREQDAVLHGIGEGVVAVDPHWRVTVVNDEARRLLGLDTAAATTGDSVRAQDGSASDRDRSAGLATAPSASSGHGPGDVAIAPAEPGRSAGEADAAAETFGTGGAAAEAVLAADISRAARALSGRAIDDIGLTPRVLQVFRAADGVPVQAAVGDRIVVITARLVRRDGRELGAVLSVRDRTDVESLTRQLDAVRSMSTVLRAQRHEFANRLHLLNGLLHDDRASEAAQYISELLGSGPLGAALPGMDAVHDPYLQAFLAAKAAHARESGVTLRLGPNTWVDASLVLPVDVTTVLGNLLDNAIEAARVGEPPREVEVELLREDSTLHLAVVDSGRGIAPGLTEAVFTEGVSTRPDTGLPGGRGVGLALARQIARALGGDVRLAHPGGRRPDGRDSEAVGPGGDLAAAQGIPLSSRDAGMVAAGVFPVDAPVAPLAGAEFIARLPGVLVEGESAWAERI
ncbi:ATP-binding protein [Nocardia yamanashiensis]|uniref:ATP-binding protein n=1 Tax=Nocardia yamanashiensis TaxID=209247 RepID=UPI0038CD151B